MEKTAEPKACTHHAVTQHIHKCRQPLGVCGPGRGGDLRPMQQERQQQRGVQQKQRVEQHAEPRRQGKRSMHVAAGVRQPGETAESSNTLHSAPSCHPTAISLTTTAAALWLRGQPSAAGSTAPSTHQVSVHHHLCSIHIPHQAACRRHLGPAGWVGSAGAALHTTCRRASSWAGHTSNDLRSVPACKSCPRWISPGSAPLHAPRSIQRSTAHPAHRACLLHVLPASLTRGSQQLCAVADGCDGLACLHKVLDQLNDLQGECRRAVRRMRGAQSLRVCGGVAQLPCRAARGDTQRSHSRAAGDPGAAFQ